MSEELGETIRATWWEQSRKATEEWMSVEHDKISEENELESSKTWCKTCTIEVVKKNTREKERERLYEITRKKQASKK